MSRGVFPKQTTAPVLAVMIVALGAACVIKDDDNTPTHSGGVGDECNRDGDCRELLACVSRICAPTGSVAEGGYCELTADCMEGFYCSYSRQCTPAGESAEGSGCSTTADCEAGLICVLDGLSGVCRESGDGDVGDVCTSAADCLPGLVCPHVPAGTSYCSTPAVNDEPEPRPALPYWEGEICGEEGGDPLAYFRVPRHDGTDHDFYRLPFPNDARRPGGHLDLTGYPHAEGPDGPGVMGVYLDALEADVHGFARNVVVHFRFSTAMNYDTVHEAILFVNVTPGSPDYGREHGYGWYATNSSGSNYICPNWLAITSGSGRPLQPGETYAIILDDTLLPSEEGSSYARATDLTALLATIAPVDEALTLAYDAYEPLRTWIADNAVDRETILSATVFTTQETAEPMSLMRDVIRGRAAPAASELTTCDTGVTSPCEDGTGVRACVAADGSFHEIHGRLELPIFQAGEAPYAVEGGEIDLDADGTPTVVRTEEVCFAMTIPTGAPLPDEGYPVVVYGHGTGGSYRNAVTTGIAGALAVGEIGGEPVAAATVTIDFPQHGERRGGSAGGPDVLFFNFANPQAARGNVLQGAADLMSVIYWLESFDLAAGESPTSEAIRFDPARIAMFAHSQGGTHAGLMVPFEPSLLAVVLSGAGGHLTQSLVGKSEPVDIAGSLPFALLDANSSGALTGGASHPALVMFQTYFEIVDPVNFGGLLRPDDEAGRPMRHLFMTYGLDDSYTPEMTQRALARAAALTLVEPVLTRNSDDEEDAMGLRTEVAPMSGNVTASEQPWTVGVRQYQPDADDDGHFVSTRTAQGAADTMQFLLQALSGAVPEIGQ